MKKLLSVLLSLMLLMPAAALAQTAEETVTVDFDDFILELGANDVYETGEKVSNKVLVQVYLPQPDASTYVITFTAATEEGLNRLTGYLDAIVFK